MSDRVPIDLFAEDRAHEEWITPLIKRIATEENLNVEVRVRSARGGHGKAMTELKLYQQAFQKTKGLGREWPSLLVVAIDGNCKGHVEAQAEIRKTLIEPFDSIAVLATPDPHIERWFLADLEAFHNVVGATPNVPSGKCERGFYKNALADAVAENHPATLGGIEFAQELVAALDSFRAGKADKSLKHFIEDLRIRLRASSRRGDGQPP